MRLFIIFLIGEKGGFFTSILVVFLANLLGLDGLLLVRIAFDSSYPEVKPERSCLERNPNENTKRCRRSDLLRTFWTDSPFKVCLFAECVHFSKLKHPVFFFESRFVFFF